MVPHPLKDAGGWIKEFSDGRWHYPQFVVQDYFREGPIEKSREDAAGNVVIASLTTQRRTLSIYFTLLTNSGFSVEELLEPRPEREQRDDSVYYSKTSRVPYFLVFRCSARESASGSGAATKGA